METVEYEFIRLESLPPDPARRTLRYRLLARHVDYPVGMLGTIEWYDAWDQYCFFPAKGTVWLDGGLADIQDFLAKLAEERKEVPR